MEQKLPKDPVMLLSYVNTLLRDRYGSLEELCAVFQVQEEELKKQLAGIDYGYDVELNQFR